MLCLCRCSTHACSPLSETWIQHTAGMWQACTWTWQWRSGSCRCRRRLVCHGHRTCVSIIMPHDHDHDDRRCWWARTAYTCIYSKQHGSYKGYNYKSWDDSCSKFAGKPLAVTHLGHILSGSTFMCAVTMERSQNTLCTLYTNMFALDTWTFE